jgi:CDP-glucose 4,6-dehydratase
MENLVNQQWLESFYKGKKVFLTGHTGFKGSWLGALLHQLGAKVKGYALEPEYEQGLYNILSPLHIVESVIGDIRDKKRMKEEILAFQPDYLFHLAAQPLVRRSYIIPAETFEVNVAGTANVLEIVKDIPGKCIVVVITTDKVYENKEQDILYKEEDALGGHDPYSASKACTELVVDCFRKSFFEINTFTTHQKAIASARAGNVIGGGDWSEDRIVPDIIRALTANRVVEVRNPDAVRPWQHVLEPLAGYLLLGGMLGQHPEVFSKPFNFGPYPEDHLPVRSLVELAIKTWSSGKWTKTAASDQAHEAGLLKLDISRAIAELKWKPKLDATKAIEWTIDWYRQPFNKQAEYTFNQIKKYLEA